MATKFIGSDGLTKLITLVKSLVNTKQNTISVDGILEGDGSGNITAADLQEVTVLTVDSSPTQGSDHLVQSGGVWTAIQNAGGGATLPETTALLKGDGQGNAVAAVGGTDYARMSDIPTVSYPVTSVNGETGAVVLDNTDVGAAASSHAHGKIQNNGTLQTTDVSIGSGDKLVITDANSTIANQIVRSNISFDGSTTNKYLSPKGTWENVPTVSYPVTSVNGETGAVVLDASDVGALPDSTTIPQGTVTSVRVQASSPLQSSISTEQNTSLNTTISFSSQNKNLVLAGPSSGSTAAAPTFRSLVAEDIPTITKSKISDFPTIDSTPTDGNTNNLVSSDGVYDKVLARTKLYTASCSTAAGTAAKVATLDDSSGFSLTAGVMVAVRFTYGNSATTPTLRVDGSTTGTAKTIAIPSSTTGFITGSGTTYNTWGAYETLVFTYNGTYWVNTGSALLEYLAYNKANSISVPSAADATPLMDSGTAAVGTSTDYAREDHVHPSDTSKADKNHASSSTDYGTGTSSNYGHVKLSDSTNSTNGTSNGTAATPSAVKAAYDLANGKQDALVSGTNIKTINSNSILGSGNIDVDSLPTQSSSTNGKYLKSNGTTGASWETITGFKTTQSNISSPSSSGTSMSFIDTISQNTNGEITATKKSIDTEGVTGVSIDNVPMDNSTNLVKSGGVKSALDAKQNKILASGILEGDGTGTISATQTLSATLLDIDDAPTADSNNLVTSGGVHTALRNLDPFPSQTGNSGKFLTTDGTDIEWETVDIDAALNNKITYGTTDLTPGTSTLATGVIYLVYE